MPDPAKHDSLVRSGFKIQKVCETCDSFRPSGGWWGRCALKVYEHAKHGRRLAGVPPVGYCDDHKPNPDRTNALVGADYAERYVDGT